MSVMAYVVVIVVVVMGVFILHVTVMSNNLFSLLDSSSRVVITLSLSGVA